MIEIMDTTLRDGEQTSGVSFTESEKLNITKFLLEKLKVNRVEVASARVSDGEFESLKKITAWAKSNNFLDKIEVLGFIDNLKSLNWIKEAGGKSVNLLCKGSLNHLKNQLRKNPKDHLKDIQKTIKKAVSLRMNINIYFEDWSNGMIQNQDYIFFLIDSLKETPIKRFMLPDTLGILSPYQVYDFCTLLKKKYSDLHFDFHGHNDYDLAMANSLAAIKAGINGLHTSVNGLGERAGNTSLASLVGVIADHTNIKTSIKEKNLYPVTKLVESFSGLKIGYNTPIVGENVFTQTCGVHADGDNKGNLYFNNLLPERFGRKRKYALGKTSGKANIKKNLDEIGIKLSEENTKKVTQKIIELGDNKENINIEDLPLIVSDVIGNSAKKDIIKLLHYNLSNSKDIKPTAFVQLEAFGDIYEEGSKGDGMYDAFVRCIIKIYEKLNKSLPILSDYEVMIRHGGKTNRIIQTIITWEKKNGDTFKTVGVNSDQTAAAIEATMKMLNLLNY